MANEALKGLIRVVLIAGAMGAAPTVASTVKHHNHSVSAPAPEAPPVHRRVVADEGCRELPAAAPAPVASCS